MRSGLFPAGGRDRLYVKFAARLAFDLKLLVRSLDTQEHVIADRRVRHEPKRKLLVFKDQVHGTSLRPQAAVSIPNAFPSSSVAPVRRQRLDRARGLT